jgi:hypothetical protein
MVQVDARPALENDTSQELDEFLFKVPKPTAVRTMVEVTPMKERKRVPFLTPILKTKHLKALPTLDDCKTTNQDVPRL